MLLDDRGVNHNMTFLEQMAENSRKLDAVQKRLQTMFSVQPPLVEVRELGGVTFDKSIEVETVFETPAVTVTKCICPTKGLVYPLHSHENSKEYLICVSGSFIITFESGSKPVAKGDCVSIPLGVQHSSTSLEPNSVLLGICIPPEGAYISLSGVFE